MKWVSQCIRIFDRNRTHRVCVHVCVCVCVCVDIYRETKVDYKELAHVIVDA